MPTDDQNNADSDTNSGEDARPRIYTSSELFKGRNEVWIEHGDDMYCLRITSSGKLLMVK